jgi:hypothetical protein
MSIPVEMLFYALSQSLPNRPLLRGGAHAPAGDFIDAAKTAVAFIPFGMHGAH